VKTAVEMMPGRACGRMTSKKAPIREAPSTMAAASRSCGMPAMNERSSHTAKGRANVAEKTSMPSTGAPHAAGPRLAGKPRSPYSKYIFSSCW